MKKALVSALATVLVLFAVPATPAAADTTKTVWDARGDANRAFDIRWVRYRHTDNGFVSVRVKFRDFNRNTAFQSGFSLGNGWNAVFHWFRNDPKNPTISWFNNQGGFGGEASHVRIDWGRHIVTLGHRVEGGNTGTGVYTGQTKSFRWANNRKHFKDITAKARGLNR